MKKAANAFIGTSGWTYKSWKERFYPTELAASKYLKYYSREFDTTEINYSFYKLPSLESFEKWSTEVDDDFVFAIKASRFLTHMKKLKDPQQPWQLIVEHSAGLNGHRGPILLQFPERWGKNLERLKEFLEVTDCTKPALRLTFEFRHESWFEADVLKLLEKYNAAVCIADSSHFIRKDVVTADFAYFRYHGRGSSLYSSSYSKKQLERESEQIHDYLEKGFDVFAYFNNDVNAHAVKNAKSLAAMVKS